MELTRVTDRVWYYPFEKERDRPILGYVKGNDWSLAVMQDIQNYILWNSTKRKKAGLSMPTITVLAY